MEIQLGLFESILDILYLKPLFICGLILIGLLLYLVFRKNENLPKFRMSIEYILLYSFGISLSHH